MHYQTDSSRFMRRVFSSSNLASLGSLSSSLRVVRKSFMLLISCTVFFSHRHSYFRFVSRSPVIFARMSLMLSTKDSLLLYFFSICSRTPTRLSCLESNLSSFLMLASNLWNSLSFSCRCSNCFRSPYDYSLSLLFSSFNWSIFVVSSLSCCCLLCRSSADCFRVVNALRYFANWSVRVLISLLYTSYRAFSCLFSNSKADSALRSRSIVLFRCVLLASWLNSCSPNCPMFYFPR